MAVREHVGVHAAGGQEQEQDRVTFSLTWEHGRLDKAATSSPAVTYFLETIRLSRSYNTWLNYTHDLKVFFAAVGKPVDQIGREDCIAFLQQQEQAGRARATVNRRLAAVSALFSELCLLDAERYPYNPVVPSPVRRSGRQPARAPGSARSLYRRAAQHLPDRVPQAELLVLFQALPTWRDRTLLLLMWLSCLRISEAVSLRFDDIECSHRQLHIRAAKNGWPRTVYMEPNTFTALNRYLDLERHATAAPDEDTLFVACRGPFRGHALSVNAVQKLLVYHARRCRLTYLHAHLLRHTGISQLLEAGMAEPAIRSFVGHRRPESLLPYTHLHDAYVEAAFAQAAPVLDTTFWTETTPHNARDARDERPMQMNRAPIPAHAQEGDRQTPDTPDTPLHYPPKPPSHTHSEGVAAAAAAAAASGSGGSM